MKRSTPWKSILFRRIYRGKPLEVRWWEEDREWTFNYGATSGSAPTLASVQKLAEAYISLCYFGKKPKKAVQFLDCYEKKWFDFRTLASKNEQDRLFWASYAGTGTMFPFWWTRVSEVRWKP